MTKNTIFGVLNQTNMATQIIQKTVNGITWDMITIKGDRIKLQSSVLEDFKIFKTEDAAVEFMETYNGADYDFKVGDSIGYKHFTDGHIKATGVITSVDKKAKVLKPIIFRKEDGTEGYAYLWQAVKLTLNEVAVFNQSVTP